LSSVLLHPTKGLNPHLTICRICGKDDAIILVGRRDYKDICCKCGMVHVGGANRTASWHRKVCSQCYGDEFRQEPISEFEKFPMGVCDECREDAGCFFCMCRKKDGADFSPGGKPWPCFDHEPCDKCRGYMEQGIIIISVDPGSDPKNPYRTGGFWVIKEEAVRRLFTEEKFLEKVLRHRMAFVETAACKAIGLPGAEKLKAEKENETHQNISEVPQAAHA
jgi:hypothetical protein